MKIVDAKWELRNLNKKVYEIELDNNDTDDEFVLNSLRDLPNCDYSCIKIPVARLKLMRKLETLGYNFVEMLTRLEVVKLPILFGPLAKMRKYLFSKVSDTNEKEFIFHNIKKGMFSTDRYSLDDNFSTKQSTNRYIGWINDVLKNGGNLCSILYKEDHIGFFLIKHLEKKCYISYLAGVFENVAPIGSGVFINQMAYEHCFKDGARSVYTTFSSNNVSAASIYNLFETRLIWQKYVYTMHHKQRTFR
jgi:hypothetical protein